MRPLGYSIPLNVKRGYHLHLTARGNAVLHHPVLDSDRGYLLAPMNRGIRLTTGVEFAHRDAPSDPIQVERALPRAHALFPLGDPIDAKPWKGARPCLPDMLPVIGKAPRHPGLWFDFGHQHHGLTLGPATGRLLAEMMTGETPFAGGSYPAGGFGGPNLDGMWQAVEELRSTFEKRSGTRDGSRRGARRRCWPCSPSGRCTAIRSSARSRSAAAAAGSRAPAPSTRRCSCWPTRGSSVPRNPTAARLTR